MEIKGSFFKLLQTFLNVAKLVTSKCLREDPLKLTDINLSIEGSTIVTIPKIWVKKRFSMHG